MTDEALCCIRTADPAHDSAIGFAHFRTPGQGMLQRPMNKRWCVKCQCDKPTLGSTQRNRLFVCAECSTPKVEAHV